VHQSVVNGDPGSLQSGPQRMAAVSEVVSIDMAWMPVT
jgi:hypothetical protein